MSAFTGVLSCFTLCLLDYTLGDKRQSWKTARHLERGSLRDHGVMGLARLSEHLTADREVQILSLYVDLDKRVY